jgi:soluble P-type ATPase
MWTIEIPGADPIRLEHLVLDINGTLTNRGELIDGVAERLAKLAGDLELHILTADTLGTANALGDRLGVSVKGGEPAPMACSPCATV